MNVFLSGYFLLFIAGCALLGRLSTYNGRVRRGKTVYVSESSNMSEGGSSSDRSGAGDIWEQSSGLRWQLVQEQEERIPGRSRSSSRRDGPVDPGLSIQVVLKKKYKN